MSTPYHINCDGVFRMKHVDKQNAIALESQWRFVCDNLIHAAFMKGDCQLKP